ncbi:MAG TPA: glutamate-1-semialdehyde 2,1-aminomutase [Terriglobales bacterium]|jgi:glutamate-1-semialdehyde 2,1-aminomutase|nr:glutamate-1-semialdehyde 2,1-aminomutase [Terriglobales bacterium]
MARRFEQSRELRRRAEAVIPGGVNSPVRAFRAVGGDPPFITRGEGAHTWDADGNEYIDYVGSWGPLILGHAAPVVVEAIIEAARKGTSFGASTPSEVDLAEAVLEAYPSMEKLRFVSSGTEATMSAIRLARAFTQRKYIVKFEGCYHGHSDALLVKAGSGVATLGIPGSAGVPEEFVQFTLALPYNDPNAVEDAFKKYKGEIACVIVEPVVGNMGCVAPRKGYLDALRYLTSRDNALLIFDEVMTGFRVAFGGAQELYGTRPDITTLGKIIGGGLPVGAYGGPSEIMDMIAPLGPVYQAGTLSGNPLAMAAGLATICHLRDNREVYGRMERMAATLVQMVSEAATEAGVAVTANRVGSMFTWFFTTEIVTDWRAAATCNTQAFGRFHHGMLDAGVYLPPSQFEAAFLGAAHTDEDISQTVAAGREALAAVQV